MGNNKPGEDILARDVIRGKITQSDFHLKQIDYAICSIVVMI